MIFSEIDSQICFSQRVLHSQLHDEKTVTQGIGDKIESSENAFEPLVGWISNDAEHASNFYEIHLRRTGVETADSTENTTLQVTGNHLLWVNDSFLLAERVKAGDRFSHNFVAEKILRKIRTDGVFSPITASGTLVLEGELLVSVWGRVDADPSAMGRERADKNFFANFSQKISKSSPGMIMFVVSSHYIRLGECGDFWGKFWEVFGNSWLWGK